METKLPQDFDQIVRQAIVLLKNSSNFNTNEEFIRHLTNNGIDYISAVEIFLFLPITFVRQWLPKARWHDTYIESIDKKRNIEKKYSETKSYQIIWQVTIQYFKDNYDMNTILKIAGRSSEFNVINNLLLANPNAKLEEIQLSKTVIMR